MSFYCVSEKIWMKWSLMRLSVPRNLNVSTNSCAIFNQIFFNGGSLQSYSIKNLQLFSADLSTVIGRPTSRQSVNSHRSHPLAAVYQPGSNIRSRTGSYDPLKQLIRSDSYKQAKRAESFHPALQSSMYEEQPMLPRPIIRTAVSASGQLETEIL
jgi:hypothetical protein